MKPGNGTLRMLICISRCAGSSNSKHRHENMLKHEGQWKWSHRSLPSMFSWLRQPAPRNPPPALWYTLTGVGNGTAGAHSRRELYVTQTQKCEFGRGLDSSSLYIITLSGNACNHWVHGLLSSCLLSRNVKVKNIQNYNSISCFVWVWNLVSNTEGTAQTEGVWEQGAEGNIWT
jgi:hypothetical protein